MRPKRIHSSWTLMIHILKLYKDINHLLQVLNTTDGVEIKHVLRRIIGRLKILNTLGSDVCWYFLTFLPLDILISSNDKFEKTRILKRGLLLLRNSIEKMIVGRASHRFLRRKGMYINLRNPMTSLCVPSRFEDFIPGYTYIPGKRPVLLTASHATPPGSDINTAILSKRIAMRSGAHALISKIPRLFIDSNRLVGRILPFRRKLDELLGSRRIKLIIDLHSMEKRNSNMVEIGVWFGLSTTRSYIERLTKILDEYDIPYDISYRFLGGDIVFYHANKPLINAIQLEISNCVKGKGLRRLSNCLVNYIRSLGDINRQERSGR